MGRFGRRDDGPRVVGFDFGTPPAPPASWTPPAAPPPAPPAAEPWGSPVAVEAPPAAPSLPPPAWGAPAPYNWGPAPKKQTATWVKVLAAVGGVVLVGAVVNGIVTGLETTDSSRTAPPAPSRPLVAPATFAGQKRLTTELARSMESDIVASYPGEGAVAAVYGRDTGHYLLILVPPTKGMSQRTVFAAAAEGMEHAKGVDVGSGRSILGMTCAPVTSPIGKGAACAWLDGRSSAYVWAMDKPDLTALAKAAVAARDAVAA